MENLDLSGDSRAGSTSLDNGVILIDLTTEEVRELPSSSIVVASEDELQSESETEIREDNKDEDWTTKGSIHRLCMNKIRKLLNLPDATERKIIDTLVKNFNERKDTSGNYELEPESEQESDLLRRMLPRDNFHIRLYVSQRRGSVPPILKWYRSGRKSGPIHLVWFFYRSGEIFAFTTNQGHRLVHDYSEFDFPNKIAARLCTDKGFRVRKKRNLVGQDWEESKTTKHSERPSTSDLPSVYSTFTSTLRHNASIRGVTSFSYALVNVKFKACSVSFPCKLKIMDLPKVLNHLSAIAKGLPTFTYVGNPEEPADEADSQNSAESSVLEISNTVYDSFLVPVNEELHNQLDLELSGRIRQAAVTQNYGDLPFDLGYKHHNDFAMPVKVELVCKVNKRKENVLLSNRPSLAEILSHLRLVYEWSGRTVFHARAILKEVRIRFTTSTNKSKDDNLLSFLEGELFYNNQTYWRVRNLWYEPMDSYVAAAYQTFIELLQEHYLKPEIPNHLIKGFPTPQRGSADCVKEYTKKYKGLNGYYLPPAGRPGLFDLMYIDSDNKIWFYFIAYNFMAHTTNLCTRMNSCLEAIKAASEDQKGPFRRFYDELDPESRVRLGESFQTFQIRLRGSHLVYGHSESSLTTSATGFCSQTLREEKDRPAKISQEVLEDVMRNMENGELLGDLATAIHASLLNEGYIDSNDLVTAKFLYCTENTFTGPGMGRERTRAAVYQALTRFKSGFNSLRARFELLFIARKAIYSTKFIIQDVSSHDASALI